eukprot:Skav227754  [mRNA]  locus=scaffold1653:21180:25330:- [translate_table: standard]
MMVICGSQWLVAWPPANSGDDGSDSMAQLLLHGGDDDRHVFHLVDARNHKLLPGDKQLLHLLAKAQRRSVRYTIVITKIDVCKRAVANDTAKRIKEELAPYCDVDIMFASARSLRGVDHLWSKIWQSATKGPQLSELLEIPDYRSLVKTGGPMRPKLISLLSGNATPEAVSFDGGSWAEDQDYDPREAQQNAGGQEYFDDKWGEDLNEESDLASNIDSG